MGACFFPASLPLSSLCFALLLLWPFLPPYNLGFNPPHGCGTSVPVREKEFSAKADSQLDPLL